MNQNFHTGLAPLPPNLGLSSRCSAWFASTSLPHLSTIQPIPRVTLQMPLPNFSSCKLNKYLCLFVKTLPEAQRTQGIASLTWIISPAKNQHWFQFWSPGGAICISCKIVHQMAPLALVPNLATRWSHMHWLQIWPPDGTTCISYKLNHQVESLASVAKLSTRWRHLH